MILRVLRGRAQVDDLPSLLDAVRADVTDWAAIDAGMVSAQPAFRSIGDDAELLLVSTWRDVEAVMARGGEVTLPRGRLGASDRLHGARALHYELMMGVATDDARPAGVVRLSSISIVPRLSTAFYEEVRRLWAELVGDAGLVALHVGRRVRADSEQAVVASAWESDAALDAATSGGFVGGERMRSFYAAEPLIEHYTALTLEPRQVA